MNITFIGNCQTISLCFYFQELFNNDENYNICWVSYGDEFKTHLNTWCDKCKNKMIDYDKSIQIIKDSDIIKARAVTIKSNNNTILNIPIAHVYSFGYIELLCARGSIMPFENHENSDLKFPKYAGSVYASFVDFMKMLSVKYDFTLSKIVHNV